MESSPGNARKREIEAQIAGMPDEPEDGWKNWVVALPPDQLSRILAKARALLLEPPDPDSDDDFAIPLDGVAFAFQVLEQEQDDSVFDLLYIELIDGPMPGSNYQAAELRISIEEANEIASEEGFKYRFVAAQNWGKT